MLLRQFLASDENVRSFVKAANALRDLGAFALLLELLARKAEERVQADTISKADATTAAIQREAWSRGYYEALTDVFEFQKHARVVRQAAPQATFGAAESLVADNTITREEYERIAGRPWTGD